jgi:hypothetical protein
MKVLDVPSIAKKLGAYYTSFSKQMKYNWGDMYEDQVHFTLLTLQETNSVKSTPHIDALSMCSVRTSPVSCVIAVSTITTFPRFDSKVLTSLISVNSIDRAYMKSNCVLHNAAPLEVTSSS